MSSTGYERFTEQARRSLELALREALSLGHNYIGTEHILLGLLRQDGTLAARVFDALKNRDAIRNQVLVELRGDKPKPVSEARVREIVAEELDKR